MEQNVAISNKDNICAEEKIKSKDILRILENHNKDRGGLISILEEIQAEFGFLPEEALRIVSERTGRSLVDIYGVATFTDFLVCSLKASTLFAHVSAQPAMFVEHQGL